MNNCELIATYSKVVVEKKTVFFQTMFFIVEKKLFFQGLVFFSFFFKNFLNAFNLLLKVV